MDPLFQRFAFQILHNQVRATLFLADVMQRADIRVIQAGGGPRLAPETVRGHLVARELAGQELESDKSLQPGILGLVDNTHAAASDLFEDRVMRNGPAGWGAGAIQPAFTRASGQRPRGYFDG